MLFRETAAVYCENRTEHKYTYCVGRMQTYSILEQVVHSVVTTVLWKINTA
jgi:hypothetical protein